MQRRPVGLFGRAMEESIKRAEAMQARAVLQIREAYGIKEERLLEIEELTWEKFNILLDTADRTGRREELEDELREMLLQSLNAVYAQQPQEQANG